MSTEVERRIVEYARDFYSSPGIFLVGVSDKIEILPSNFDRNKTGGYYRYSVESPDGHGFVTVQIFLHEVREESNCWDGVD